MRIRRIVHFIQQITLLLIFVSSLTTSIFIFMVGNFSVLMILKIFRFVFLIFFGILLTIFSFLLKRDVLITLADSQQNKEEGSSKAEARDKVSVFANNLAPGSMILN